MTETPFRPDVRLNDGRLRFEYRYEQGIDRVWQALTDDAELSTWTPWTTVRLEAVVGGTVALSFPGGDPMHGEIIEAEPGRALALQWPGNDEDEVLRWTLRPDGDGTRLTFDITLQDLDHVTQTAAGYHLSLLHLHDLLAGNPVQRADIPPNDPRFWSLVDSYEAELGAPGEGAPSQPQRV